MRNSYRYCSGLIWGLIFSAVVASASWPALAGTPLELKDSIQIAVRQSPAVLLARQKLQLALARLQRGQAALFPLLDVGASKSYGGRLQNTSFPQSWEQTDEYALSLKIHQSLSPLLSGLGVDPGLSGQAGVSGALSRLDLRAAEAQFQKDLETLVIDVISKYIEVLKAENNLTLSQKSVEKAQTYLFQAQAKFEQGTILKVDLLKMQTQLATTRYNLLRAENALKDAQAGFNRLLGYPADQPLKLAANLPSGLFAGDTGDTGDAGVQASVGLQKEIASALDKRSEIVLEKIAVQQARIKASQARTQTWPTFTLTGSYGNSDDLNGSISLETKDWNLTTDISKGASLSGTGSARASQDPQDWAVTLGLKWNLFDGGSARSSMREADLTVSQAETNLHQTEDTVAQDVRRSHHALLEAHSRLPALEAARTEAEENLKVVSAQYRAGEKTAADLFDAELALLAAQNDYKDAQLDQLVAEAVFQRATGNLDISRNFGVELPRVELPKDVGDGS
ncbi:MAG: TolC family protein [Syntrophothermus sp.]